MSPTHFIEHCGIGLIVNKLLNASRYIYIIAKALLLSRIYKEQSLIDGFQVQDAIRQIAARSENTPIFLCKDGAL
jgi:hypothetical protein